MSIQNEIDRIVENVANAYSVLDDVGADMPTVQNTDNLPETVISIKAVLYGKEQALTEEQKAQARHNIGAASIIDVPVKGIDYWTEADQEDIVQQVIAALGTPVFGTVDKDNKITLSSEHLGDGTYEVGCEDKDGNWVLIGTLNHTIIPEPTYTNVLPLAINSDGTLFNGGKGYKTGYRLNSSGNETSEAGVFITGFIPINQNDQLYFKNIDWYLKSDTNNKCYVCVYDASFNMVTNGYFRDGMLTTLSNYDWAINEGSIALDENNHLTSIRLKPGVVGSTEVNAKYVRISAWNISDESIITINEPID